MTDQPVGDWWKTYFSRHYATLYRGPLAGELATEDETSALERLFAGSGGVVLDLGCGFGRHLAPLRRARVHAVGLDYSASLLESMPKALRRHAVRGDLRALPFDAQSAAGAYMLFNTFGYFDDRDNKGVLREVARVLKPGARFLLDIPARAGMVAAAREHPASIRAQGRYSIAESWSYDKAARRLNARGVWEIAGEAQQWSMGLRLYTPTEVTRLLLGAGFQKVEIRPLEELESIGTEAEPISSSPAAWRSVTNMAVLAVR